LGSFAGQLGSVRQVELPFDALTVRLDGFDAQMQIIRNPGCPEIRIASASRTAG